MGETVKDFFERLPGRVDESRTAGINASYVFEIDGAGTWTVKVDDGKVSVGEGDNGGDCRIATSRDVFERVISRDQNPATAYMMGKLKVTGDMGAALQLQKLF